MYCYLEYKLSYLKNLKLFSIRVKEISEPIVLKKRRQVLALFISIFLRNRSLSDARWFYGKKTQNWEGKSVFNWKSIKLKRNALCFRLSQLYGSHMCKGIFKFELQLSSYWQNINFSRNCPKFHIFTKIIIFQVSFPNFLDHLLHPYKFYGRDMPEILFLIFASCEPLMVCSYKLTAIV